MSWWCNDGKEMYKINNNILFFAVLLAVADAVAVVVGFVVIQK